MNLRAQSQQCIPHTEHSDARLCQTLVRLGWRRLVMVGQRDHEDAGAEDGGVEAIGQGQRVRHHA